MTWGGNETRFFDKHLAPLEVRDNTAPTSGGHRRITRHKRIVHRRQPLHGVIRSNLSYGRTRKYNVSKRRTRKR